MRVRLGFAAMVVALAVAAVGATAASAMHPAEFGKAVAASASSGSGPGQGAAAPSGTDPSGSVDPSADDPAKAAKAGKGYCAGASDGKKIPCPSHGKPAKKGKGYEIP